MNLLKKIIQISALVAFICFSVEVNAQQIWTKTSNTKFKLNNSLLSDALKNVSAKTNTTCQLKFPNINGELVYFTIKDNALMPRSLAEKYPNVHSYSGTCNSDNNLKLTFTCTPTGINGTLIKGNTVFELNQIKLKGIYKLSNINSIKNSLPAFKCSAPKGGNNLQKKSQKTIKTNSQQRALVGDSRLRVLRTAISASGEYSDYFINKVGAQSASGADKKAIVLGAINTSLNRMNIVFQRDLGVKLELVNNNDELIFLNKNTDPFTSTLNGGTAGRLSNENQTIASNTIGLSNFDIGHVVTTLNIGGLAQLDAICDGPRKAGATTGVATPEGFVFDINFFAHEIGHQLGATHTHNGGSCTEYNFNSGVEPASGTTIMGYAGICGINIKNSSDAFFHQVSIEQIKLAFDDVENNRPCSIETRPTNNTSPAIGPLNDNYYIPVNTPFFLEVDVTDAENDELTYSWEQLDSDQAAAPPESSSEFGPLFRWLIPTTNPRRNFPENPLVNTTWEVLPNVARTMNFGVTVRDGKDGGIATKQTTVNVVGSPNDSFKVTSQNTNVSYTQNSLREITWNVANTNTSPINALNVHIDLSYDGGVTYPIRLSGSTLNDGSEFVTIPILSGISTPITQNARIRISSINNIFYSVSESLFTIKDEIETNELSISIDTFQNTVKQLLVFNIILNKPATEDVIINFNFDLVKNDDPLELEQIDFSDNTFILYENANDFEKLNTTSFIIPKGDSRASIGIPSSQLANPKDENQEISLTVNGPLLSNEVSQTGFSKFLKKESSEKAKVFPNPATGTEISILFPFALENEVEILIYNLTGKLMFSGLIFENPYIHNVKDLPKGIYLISINTGKNTTIEKLVKQ